MTIRALVVAFAATALFAPVAATHQRQACNQPPAQWTPNEAHCAVTRTFPHDPVALCIAYHESRFHARAVGHAFERGVFQISPVHRSWLGARWGRMFNPLDNARAARELQRRAGWQPWTTWRVCR